MAVGVSGVRVGRISRETEHDFGPALSLFGAVLLGLSLGELVFYIAASGRWGSYPGDWWYHAVFAAFFLALAVLARTSWLRVAFAVMGGVHVLGWTPLQQLPVALWWTQLVLNSFAGVSLIAAAILVRPDDLRTWKWLGILMVVASTAIAARYIILHALTGAVAAE